eukprot:834539-Amphidinium_carterae.1
MRRIITKSKSRTGAALPGFGLKWASTSSRRLPQRHSHKKDDGIGAKEAEEPNRRSVAVLQKMETELTTDTTHHDAILGSTGTRETAALQRHTILSGMVVESVAKTCERTKFSRAGRVKKLGVLG